MATKEEIHKFWSQHLPQMSYSDKEEYTREYFDEIEKKRYETYYKYLPKILQWNKYKDKKVLEIGCGVGTEILQFAKNESIVIGIDLTKKAIEITKKRFELYKFKGRFMQADAENLPFEDNTFDLVYSLGVLHHTPNTKKAIREAYRVLKPNGKIIILLYAKGWKYYLLTSFFYNFVPEHKKNNTTETFGCPLVKIYSRKEVKRLFDFPVKIVRYRMGCYFDYKMKAFGITLMPDFIVNLAKILRLERIIGENWVITNGK